MPKELSHIDEAGNASMVDVSNKKVSARTAVASGKVTFPSDVFETLAAKDFLKAVLFKPRLLQEFRR